MQRLLERLEENKNARADLAGHIRVPAGPLLVLTVRFASGKMGANGWAGASTGTHLSCHEVEDEVLQGVVEAASESPQAACLGEHVARGRSLQQEQAQVTFNGRGSAIEGFV